MTIIGDGNMFGRRLSLQVGPVVFDAPLNGPIGTGETRGLLGDPEALRVSFNIRAKIPTKAGSTPGAEPPAATIAVYNLAERTRRSLDELIGTKAIGIAFDAGYGDDVGSIFRGHMSTVHSAQRGAEWVTTITGKTGNVAARTIINETLPPGSSKFDRMKKILDTLERDNPAVSFKRAQDRLKLKDYRGFADELTNGVTMTGHAMDHFRVLTKDLGFESWIDQDEAVVLAPDEVRGDRRVVLSPMTGLISAPDPVFDEKLPNKLIIRVRSLLQWRFGLGGVVELVTSGMSGFFRIRAMMHVGDTHGDEYSSEVEAVEVPAAFDPILKKKIQAEATFTSDAFA